MEKKHKGTDVKREQLTQIAAHASCDARTALAFIAGLPVRPLVRARIERALVELGLEHLAQKAAS